MADNIYKILTEPSPEYAAKMLHPVPDTESVDRTIWLVKELKGKRVLHFGSAGPLHGILKQVAEMYGADREGNCDFALDVETDPLPDGEYDYILCGEILEHLSNPGVFLEKLKQYDCPIIITVPNAFSETGFFWLKKGAENVNKEHVAYYSYTTLKVLIERHGYREIGFYWYNGEPLFAEGLIFVIRRQ